MKISDKTKARARAVWESVKDEKLGDLVEKLKFWAEAVSYGADPIEAMSGHLCGPSCMHWATMDKERKAQLRKAPWNQGVEG